MTCVFFFVTLFFKVDINYFKDHQQNEHTYHKLVIEMHDITISSNEEKLVGSMNYMKQRFIKL